MALLRASGILIGMQCHRRVAYPLAILADCIPTFFYSSNSLPKSYRPQDYINRLAEEISLYNIVHMGIVLVSLMFYVQMLHTARRLTWNNII